MMQRGIAIVTEVTMAPIMGNTLFRLAIWDESGLTRLANGLGADLPLPCRSCSIGDVRLLWLEAGHWLISCASELSSDVKRRFETLLDDAGTIVEVSAALVGRRLSGPGWRELLMIGGVFDAEAPAFAPGSVARTVMHHSAVLLDVVSADQCDAYVPASYSAEFFAFWDAAPVIA
jgi:heterotetrameric sarcosine oxidase gamma subunit